MGSAAGTPGPPDPPRSPATSDQPASRPSAVLLPPHRQATLALLVGAGGAVGSLGRYALARAMPVADGWPVGTLVANLLGAFALGALLEVLGRRGPETPGVLRVRLALGTGVLGGFTTFSSLALETERLLAAGDVVLAAAYAGTSLVAGVACAAAGVLAGRAVPRPAGPAGPGEDR